MVMLCDTAIERIYQVCDERGRAIGRIVAPREPKFLGRHAGTVLLIRDLPRIQPVFLRSTPDPMAR